MPVQNSTVYRIIGVMSGSSMDGLDLACCEFRMLDNKWEFSITCAETVPYPEVWISRLTHLASQPADVFVKADTFYGKYIGQLVNRFIASHNLHVDFISSHGHTVFHQPENGFTSQIGHGASIHAETGLPVVCDFRTVDIARGGQGAPLVPVGDRELFGSYDACLNLGGFANISHTTGIDLKAFDICPCNLVLNHVAGWMGLEYDDKGAIASKGKVSQALLDELNGISFYAQTGSRSLGKEWANANFWPIVSKYDALGNEDIMATFAEHIAVQLSKVLNSGSLKDVLVTGGGALNIHLMGMLKKYSRPTLTIPSIELIQYKEALIFAFLGLLRVSGIHNCIATATGATDDSIGGALYGPIPSFPVQT